MPSRFPKRAAARLVAGRDVAQKSRPPVRSGPSVKARDRIQPILDLVQKQPGISVADLSLGTGISRSAVTYWLRRLVGSGHVIQERDGRRLRHFDASEPNVAIARLAGFLTDHRHRKVAEHLVAANVAGKSVHAIAVQLGLSFGIVKRSLQWLADNKYVILQRQDHAYTLSVDVVRLRAHMPRARFLEGRRGRAHGQ